MDKNLSHSAHYIPTKYDFYYDALVFTIDAKQDNASGWNINSALVVDRRELPHYSLSVEEFLEKVKELAQGLDNPQVETEERYASEQQNLTRMVVTGLRKPYPDELRKIEKHLAEKSQQAKDAAQRRQADAERQLASIRKEFPHLV